MTALIVRKAGPAVAVQDLGRPGHIAHGLTAGGAADVLALHEGAALLHGEPANAALEMAGFGGSFEAEGDIRIALTGAEMRASIDGQPVAWNASHALPHGSRLEIGPALRGTFGYLHAGSGFDTPVYMGARATHLSVGFGALLANGDRLPLCPDPGGPTGLSLPADDRFDGGTVRIVPSMQTDAFPTEIRDRFAATAFRRDPRTNRQGMRLDHDGDGFSTPEMRSLVSEIIAPGDIQITGDGTPFILMAECHTTGGYPRIGTVIPSDLPRVAQAPSGAPLRFTFISLDDAIEIERRERGRRAALRQAARPLLRDVHDINDLLSYQLISGAVSAHDQTET